MRFIDFFAGMGGFRLGLEMAGHKCVGHCEIDKFVNKAYKAMHYSMAEMEVEPLNKYADGCPYKYTD